MYPFVSCSCVFLFKSIKKGECEYECEDCGHVKGDKEIEYEDDEAEGQDDS